MSPPPRRLVILTSTGTSEPPGPLLSGLRSWCSAGLLGDVAWVDAARLASNGGEAACEATSRRGWTRTLLIEAMASAPLSEVWVAALRGLGREPQARDCEDQARATVEGLLGSDVRMRSMTISVAAAVTGFGRSDFSAMWDFHLIHDRRTEADRRSLMEDASQGSPLTLCAMVALCAAGGWSGSTKSWELFDRPDGPWTHPRFVHSQVRVLHAPDITFFGTPGSGPWPTPQAAGVRRALPDSLPPPLVADQLVKQCRFQCERARDPAGAAEERSTLRQALFGQLLSMLPETETEEALDGLAARAGGYAEAPDANGLLWLRLHGLRNAGAVEALVEEIKRSALPIGAARGGAEGATPEVWRTVRQTMLGLVDGSTMPAGVTPVMSAEGSEGEQLVWTDPAAIAPERAPESDARLAETAEDPSPARHATDAGFSADVDGVVRDLRAGPARYATDAGFSAADGEQTAEDESPVGALAADESPIPTGGDNDTLMVQLANRLDRARERAREDFLHHAARRPPSGEYELALRARRRARRMLASTGLTVLLVAMFAADQRWPFLGDAWEWVTRSEARRTYAPMIWPIGWLAVGALVLVVGMPLSALAVVKAGDKVQALHDAERLRARLSADAVHYAGELVRLHSLVVQFEDHRRIITEMLHRPFGDPASGAVAPLDPSDLGFETPPPAAMLVCAANASAGRLNDEQRRLRSWQARRGWLTNTYHEVLGAWKTRYESRIVGDAPDPDADAAPPDTVAGRDPRDGSPVPTARVDLADAVSGNGWAVRDTRRTHWTRWLDARARGTDEARRTPEARREAAVSTDGDAEFAIHRFVGLLDAPEAVHGTPPALSADEFLDLGAQGEGSGHRFAWRDMLGPEASVPSVSVLHSGEPATTFGLEDARRMVLMSWRIEYSDPVRPSDLKGWDDEPPPDTTEGGVI